MSIEEVLSDLGIEHLQSGHHHTRPGWIQLKSCPFCGSNNFHLGYNVEQRFFSCWSCGGHNAWKVFQELRISREIGRSLLRPTDIPERTIKRHSTRGSLQEPSGRGPFHPSHVRYLKSRGFDPEMVSRIWGAEGIAQSARLAWRIYIPILYHGRRVSWTTRAVGDRVGQRYVSASAEEESVHHKSIVYGMDLCHHSIVIVEGPLDAWKVGPGAGAVFGTAYSNSQVREIAKIPHRYVCFDSAPSAQRKARELAQQLAIFPGTTENIELDAKDPGEASVKELNLLRKVSGL